jgi:aminopeptidase N
VAFLGESLATYSAMQVVEETLGHEHLRRYVNRLRADYERPRARAGVPLLRSTDDFDAYRKGPLAMYALSEYIGAERVNDALRRLFELYGSGTPPLPTSLDLYQELQAVTPDSQQYLLHDLFEENTFWELEIKRAEAVQTEAGVWQVTLDVRARKVTVDTAGVETEVPMDDWVEIGVFASAEQGEELSEPLYIHKQRIHSGEQTITVTVPRKPVLAGFDPYHLLNWEVGDIDDNIVSVTVKN